MYDIKYIESLLDKYWDAQTSIQEEILLRNYFSEEATIAENLQYAQPFFIEKNHYKSTLEKTKNIVDTSEFDEKILTLISGHEEKSIHLQPTQKAIKYGITSIAAVLVLSLGIYLKQRSQTDEKSIAKLSQLNKSMVTLKTKNSANKVKTSTIAVNLSNSYHSLHATVNANKRKMGKSENTIINSELSVAQLKIKDTYTNPDDAKKCLDSALAAMSKRYNQGFDLIMEETTDLDLLDNPYKKIKNYIKNEKHN